MTFSVFQVLEDGHRNLLADLNDEVVYIGREPPEGIQVDSKAVSREHGVFLRIANQWFFKDLGSSNGSWLNGKHVSAGIPHLLRAGDSLQLADAMIKFVSDEGKSTSKPSILVFSRGDYLSEFPIPEVGKVVSVGGKMGDLKLDIDYEELSVAIIEKRASFVCAFPVSTSNKAFINEKALTQLVQLKDRDVVTVGPYLLIANTIAFDSLSTLGMDPEVKNHELKETFTGWDEEQKTVGKTLFGQRKTDSESDDDDDVEADRTIVSDMRPGNKYAKPIDRKQEVATEIEEKVIFVLGFALVLVILGLALWWFLR